MKSCKKLISLLLVLMLVCTVSITAFAANELPELNRKGSVTVTVKDTESGKTVGGGSLMIYKVAYVQLDDGNFTFEYTDDFADCEFELGDLSDTSLAVNLADYSMNHRLNGTEVKVSENGTAVFSDLAIGVYMIVQSEPAGNYTVLNPFIVSIPLTEDDSYVYDVDATPKAGTVKEVSPIPTPTPPPSSPNLPQTGQLWWPVPLMAFCGLLFIALGWTKRRNAEG